MAHLCKNLLMPEYTISNHALFTDVFCSPEVIHVSCNILGYHLVWPFRFVAILVYGYFGLWPFRSEAVSVCGRFGCGHFGCGRFGLWPLWPVTPFCFLDISVCGRFGSWMFRFVAIPVYGRFGLWPFRLWPFRFVTVMTCYRSKHDGYFEVLTDPKEQILLAFYVTSIWLTSPLTKSLTLGWKYGTL